MSTEFLIYTIVQISIASLYGAMLIMCTYGLLGIKKSTKAIICFTLIVTLYLYISSTIVHYMNTPYTPFYKQNSYWIDGLSWTIEIVIMVILMGLKRKESFITGLTGAFLIYMFFNNVYQPLEIMILSWLRGGSVNYTPVLQYACLFMLHLLVALLTYFFFVFVKNAGITNALRSFFTYKYSWTLTVFLFFAKDIFAVITRINSEINSDYLLLAGSGILATLVGFVIIYVLLLDIIRKSALSNQVSIDNHQLHILSLRNFQMEMRTFRHDYDNMMLSMSLQLESKQSLKIQNYLEEIAAKLKFDLEQPHDAAGNKQTKRLFRSDGKVSKKIIQLYLLCIVCSICIFTVSFVSEALPMTLITILILIGILLLITVFWTLHLLYQYIKKLRLQQKEITFRQEEDIQNLEDIHNKLSALKEEYQVLLNQSIHQITQGRFDEIVDQMKSSSVIFDEGLRKEIHQSTQLGNIQVIELKSLLLTKLLKCQENGIVYQLEVPVQIDNIAMEISDFIRCTGILLDNAIEGVVSNGRIDIVIDQQKGGLKLNISNHTDSNFSPVMVEKAGYSTKGMQRGYGLSSYKRILSRYKNVLTHTTVDQQRFIQELIIRS